MKKLFVLVSVFTVLGMGAADAGQTLDLKSVCKTAIEKNPSLAGSTAQVQEANAELMKARSGLMPTLSVSSGYNYVSKQTVFGTTPILARDTLTNTVQLMQPIYTGGQVEAGVRAAKSGLAASKSARSAAESQVVTNAAAAYFRAQQAREAISVAESSVKSLEAGYDTARKLHDAGVVTNADVLRAEVALTSAKDQLIKAQNDYATALGALKLAVGLPQSEEIAISDDGSSAVLDGVEGLQPQRRPEVVAAGHAVQAAYAQLQAARASGRPTVGVVVDYFNEPKGSEFPRQSDTVGIGIMAHWDITDGGRTRAGVDAARASVDKAKSDLESVTQATDFQLESAKLALNSAKERMNALSTQVRSAEESFRVVQTGYKEGMNVLTDVLSVESTLTGARVSKLAAEYDLKIAELNLLLAMGQTEMLTK